jgi:hypothetical protein
MGSKLKNHRLGGFKGGYSSFTGSKSNLKDTEFPYGVNVVLDDNGSLTKAPGATRFGNEVTSGSAVLAGVHFKNASVDKLIVHSGTATKYKNGSSWTAMTGATFSASTPVWFCQALDRLYATQPGLGALYYTTDGLSWSSQSNGRDGSSIVFYNQRLYLIDENDIWYSNPYATASSPPAVSTSNFGSFDTDLTATPKKNAGFIRLFPGAGVEPVRLFLDQDGGTESLFVYTKRHGYWKITPVAAANSDGSISHSVSQANSYFGTEAPLSVFKVGNDQWFFDGENVNSLGEVQLYNNIRVTVKSGRVRSEMRSVNQTYPTLPTIGFKDQKVYFAYPTGTYNDRLLVFDTILGSWSAPLEGYNAAFFLEYRDGTQRRLLYGSSNPSDSYVYEIDSGNELAGAAIESVFETKSSDCERPGLIKRFARAKVFYSMVYGTLNYEVILDETTRLSGSQQLGNSASRPVGIGSQMIGTFMVGAEYASDTTFATLATNSDFDIDCEFEAAKKISIRFSNANAGEDFKIDDVEFSFIEGSPYESEANATIVDRSVSYDTYS